MPRFLRDAQTHLVSVREEFLDRVEDALWRISAGRQFGGFYIVAEVAALMLLFTVILWQTWKGGTP